MTTTEDYLMAAAFALIGGFVFFLGFYKWRRYRIIRDTPTSRIRSMAMGIVEIHGRVEADQLIKSPFSKTECVYYKWEIKEYRRSSSSSGKGSSNRWEKVDSGDQSVPFFAKDETGRVLVEPDKAEFVVSRKKAYYQKSKGLVASFKVISKIVESLKNFNPNDPASFNIGGDDLELMESGKSFHTTHVGDRKYNEYYIEPNDSLFVLGTAANDSSAPDNVVIKRGKNEKTFIISDKSEKGVLKNLKKTMQICFIAGSISIATGILILLMSLGLIPQG